MSPAHSWHERRFDEMVSTKQKPKPSHTCPLCRCLNVTNDSICPVCGLSPDDFADLFEPAIEGQFPGDDDK